MPNLAHGGLSGYGSARTEGAGDAIGSIRMSEPDGGSGMSEGYPGSLKATRLVRFNVWDIAWKNDTNKPIEFDGRQPLVFRSEVGDTYKEPGEIEHLVCQPGDYIV